MSDSRFEIEETQRGRWIRLTLSGELDLASAGFFRERLEKLKAEKSPVRLDLSQLDFIDSSGAHVLIDAVSAGREHAWPVEVEPDLSPQARRFFEILKHAGWDVGA